MGEGKSVGEDDEIRWGWGGSKRKKRRRVRERGGEWGSEGGKGGGEREGESLGGEGESKSERECKTSEGVC